jgi:prepilin-type N-terminal cleavage/methylation domain-containing protein
VRPRSEGETPMTGRAPMRQAGFSLVEVMIAMVITLIVTGSIYGLLSGGESAFRLQPEKTDIQQNGRSAMDMIMRDISSAGVGMPPFIQVFTQGLDACSGCPNGGSPAGVLGAGFADELEIVTNQENFATEDICFDAGVANDGSPALRRGLAIFAAPKGILVFTNDTPPRWAAQQVTGVPGGGGVATANCTAGHPTLTVAGGACGASGFGNALPGCVVTQISFGAVVHYRIRPDPVDAMPSLWRQSTSNLAAGYQIVARGIDDLQVQYVQAAAGCTLAAPCDAAPAVAQPVAPLAADYGTLITQVRVTLSSRSTLRGDLQGQTVVGGVRALRGQLTSTGSPRSALFALTQQTTGAPQWH